MANTQSGPFIFANQSADTQPAITVVNNGTGPGINIKTNSTGPSLSVNGTTIIDSNGNITAPISDTTPVTISVNSASPALTIKNVGAGTDIAIQGSSSGTVSLTTQAAAGTWTMTLPTTAGSANQFLQTDGTGVATWATASGFSNPMTTLGDIIYENATPAATRLAGSTSATPAILQQTGNGTISAAPAWTTTPKITAITDANGNNYLTVSATASAVDYVQITNGATGSPGTVALSAVGTDSGINLNLVSKGSGTVQFNGGGLGVASGGTGTTTAFTQNSIVFAGASGVYSQHNTHFSWNDATSVFQISDGTSTGKMSVTTGGTDQCAIGGGNSTDLYLQAGGVNQLVFQTATSIAEFIRMVVKFDEGVQYPVNPQTTAYTITASDYTVLASGTTTITLPTAVGITGQVYVIKNTDATHTVTIATTSSQTIDGATTVSLSAQYQMRMVQSDGANWQVISKI